MVRNAIRSTAVVLAVERIAVRTIITQNAIRSTAVVLAVAVLLGGCGLRRKKYTNPITKDTQQPDKVLFDKAINDIEHSRFEVARLLLQNLINTYDTSEY